MSPNDILVIVMIGVSAGLLSGLVGVGGGIILVPAMVYFLGYTQHQALHWGYLYSRLRCLRS